MWAIRRITLEKINYCRRWYFQTKTIQGTCIIEENEGKVCA